MFFVDIGLPPGKGAGAMIEKVRRVQGFATGRGDLPGTAIIIDSGPCQARSEWRIIRHRSIYKAMPV